MVSSSKRSRNASIGVLGFIPGLKPGASSIILTAICHRRAIGPGFQVRPDAEIMSDLVSFILALGRGRRFAIESKKTIKTTNKRF